MVAKTNDILLRLEAGMNISLYEYMSFCLYDEACGYYRNIKALGQEGDFVTSPDISQVFGEMLGFWLLDLWQRCGEPPYFTIIELGGGRGTAMRDILHLLKRSPMFEAMQITMVEMNPHFQKIQKHLLADFPEKVIWVESFDAITTKANAIIANEFLDCLPIQQFVFRNGKWHERQIKMEENELQFCLQEIETLPCELPEEAPKENDILEYSPDMPKLIEKISSHSLATLLIDYGYGKTAYGDTLQALKHHKYSDVLSMQGMPDLSAHVNFQAVTQATSLQPAPLMTQHEFINSMGGALRLQKLLQNSKNEAQKKDLTKAYQRITDLNGMGGLFKTLMLYQENLAQ